MSQQTESLVRDLSRDLAPVVPLARLRSVVILALGLSIPFYAGWLYTAGLRPQFARGEAPGPMFVLTAAVALALAVGGLGVGLATAVPGREGAARRSRVVLVGGVALALGMLAVQSIVGSTSIIDAIQSSVGCFRGAAILALPAAMIAVQYVFRGAARDSAVSAALACAGGLALAALLVHLTCAHDDPLHMVVGHALAPVLGGLLLLVALRIVAIVASLWSLAGNR